MLEEIRKLMLAGIGGAAMTVDKTQDMIDRLVARGKLTVDEGKKLSEELIQRTKTGEMEEDPLSREELQTLLIEMNVAQRKDIEDLERKVDELIARVAELSNK
ncbi:phasin family protein [Atopococcus tabaci]|uniref:phasin family protein n=1 Tax=Atopococcus tabaci TaxID=269774 RepID=UPI00041A759C|nr:hypothetical protein [Atopococcus tabaci]